MLILGIDTCCMTSAAAVADETKIIAHTAINHKRTHSQMIMPQIENMLTLAEIEIGDIDYFAAAVGPGSFTGVRIGVATIKALAQACGKSCVAVSTLEALAYENKLFDGVICPILDARREQVYNALFKGGNLPARLCDDRALALEELLNELENLSEPVIFCGDGTLVFKDKIQEKLGERAVFAPAVSNLNSAAAVAELAFLKIASGEEISCGEMIPEYIRLSQAERERMEKQNSKKD